MTMRDMSRFGTKHTCYGCGTKFYDLNKPEAICPKCGANQKDAPEVEPMPIEAPAIRPRPVVEEPPDEDDSFDDDAVDPGDDGLEFEDDDFEFEDDEPEAEEEEEGV